MQHSHASEVLHIVLTGDARFFLATPPAAPHEATYWPDINAICRLMAAHDCQRYVAVHDDVIVRVPAVARLQIGGIPSSRIYQKHVAASAIAQARLLEHCFAEFVQRVEDVQITHKFNFLS